MSNKKDEALKLALECVEAWDRGCDRDTYWRDIEAAVTAIKEALAEQPAPVAKAHKQQDPVLWLVNGVIQASDIPKDYTGCLFTSPPAQQEPVSHSIVAGALFDFMGWLTSRNECLVLSSTDDAAPAADAIKDFAHMRNLSIDDAKVREWQEHLASPPASKTEQQEPMAKVCHDLDGHIGWNPKLTQLPDEGTPLYTSPPASKPLTDEMVVAAARMLSDRRAAECNVDCGDMWKMHGNDFIEDARAALEAAHGIKEKNT